VVVFKPELAATIAYRRKRGGHLFSKMRFLSAQLEAYLAGDLWLRNARHANAQARRIAEGFAALPGVHLVHPVEGNEIFAEMPKALADGLARDGFELQAWAGTPERPTLRMVAAFDTEPADVDRLLASARKRQAA
jgi:threonine aldolase